MFGDVRLDSLNALTVRPVLLRCSPSAARMKRVPRRAFVFSRFRVVTVLSEAVANIRFVVPNRLKPVD